MFTRKPKILIIGSLRASPNHFVRFRASPQTMRIFTALFSEVELVLRFYNAILSADGIGKESVKKFSSKAVENSSCLRRSPKPNEVVRRSCKRANYKNFRLLKKILAGLSKP